MVNFRATVTLCLFAAAANASNNIGKRYLPVRESSEGSLEAPTSTVESSPAVATTTAEASEIETSSWAPTTTDAPVETTSINHASPMTPIEESSQASLEAPAPSTSAAEQSWSPAVVQTENSETALATPTRTASPTWVYAPTTSAAPVVVQPTSQSQFTYAPSSSPDVQAPASSSEKYVWAPTTAEGQSQPTFTYAPAASSSSNGVPVILPIPVSSSGGNSPIPSSHGAEPLFYTGPPETKAQPAQTSAAIPLFYTGPPETKAQPAQTSPAAYQPSASHSEALSASASPYNNKPAQSQSQQTSAGIETATTHNPNAVTTPLAHLPTTLATSLSTIEICPTDDTSCHTVVVTPRPATATASSSVSNDDGILVYNGHTMSMSAATLAAAPTKVAGASGAGASGSAGSAGLHKGAAVKLNLGMGLVCGMFGVVGMVMML